MRQLLKDKGFEIIGMDNEIAMQNNPTTDDMLKGTEKVRALVKDQGITVASGANIQHQDAV